MRSGQLADVLRIFMARPVALPVWQAVAVQMWQAPEALRFLAFAMVGPLPGTNGTETSDKRASISV
jgi:hypothetical protein